MADTQITATSYSAGQPIKCTVTGVPSSKGAEYTIARLMRLDPDNARALKASYQERSQNLIYRNRGGRPWAKRVIASKVVRPERGESWTMPFFPQMADDLNAVARFVKVEKA
ncbi:MAG: hypothetical protein ACTS27_08040 [Phycisphaerales bacterium]